MRFVLTLLIALSPATAVAASLEQTYYASRDAYIKKFPVTGEFTEQVRKGT